MTCDLCFRWVPDDTPMQVDASGRPVLLACTACNDRIVRERAERLGLNADDGDLITRFAAHLAREIKPVIH